MTWEALIDFPELPHLQPDVMMPMTRARYRKRWHRMMAEAIRYGAGVKFPKEPLRRVQFTGIRCSSQEPDEINLANSFKPMVDALVVHGILIDDGPAHVRHVYRWYPTPAKQGSIQIHIKEIDPG